MAHTDEGAHSVHTLPVSTQAPLRRTLIDIYAVTIVRILKAGVAETVVGAHCVLTGPIATGLSLTLVHVNTHRLVPCCFESIGADAAVAPQCVNALTRIAYTRVLNAFITV